MMTRKIALSILLFTLLAVPTTAYRDVEIADTSVPSIVKKGGDFQAVAMVRNTGNYREDVRVVVTALNQKKISEYKAVESGEKEKFVLNFTTPMEKTGPFEISFKAESSSDFDVSRISSEISEIKGYFTFSEKETKVGMPVLVKGRLVHSGIGHGASYMSAKLYEGKRFIKTVKTDNYGYFKTYFTPERVGSYTVRLLNRGVLLEKKLNVKPVVEVGRTNISENIEKGGEAEICVEPVFKGVEEVNVRLLQENGEGVTEIAKKAHWNQQTTCLDLSTDESGVHRAEIEVSSGRYSSKREFNYMVEEAEDPEPKLDVSFGKVSEKGEKVKIPVTLENRHPNSKNISVNVSSNLTLVSGDGSIEVPANSVSETELVFINKPGDYKVRTVFSYDSFRVVREKEFNISDDTPSGMMVFAATGFKTLGVLLGLGLLFLVGRFLLNPAALEPHN